MKTIKDMDVVIGKFLAGEASPEEAMLLEDWISESAENEKYFQLCEESFGLSTKAVSADEAWNKVRLLIAEEKQVPVRRLNFKWISSVAAILIVTLGAIFYFRGTNVSETIFRAGNQQKKIKLEDGTGIQLASNSSLELSPEYGKKNRSVKLKGSGYFSVKHSDKLPFIIDAGPVHIKDLGTKFNVRTTGDTIYVRVDEGMVIIYDNKGMKLTLSANESAHYVVSAGSLQLDILAENMKSVSKTILLDNQRLEDVVNLLNKTYKVDIRLGNSALKNCRITTKFLNEDLETVLMVISQTLEVTILKEKEGVYLIKGEACEQ